MSAWFVDCDDCSRTVFWGQTCTCGRDTREQPLNIGANPSDTEEGPL